MSMPKGKRWYNNGVINLRLSEDEDVPSGFYFGKLESSTKGKVCYTDGSKNLYLDPNEVPPKGFIKGSKKRPKFSCYTNGVKDIHLKEGEPIPNGYYKGKSKKTNLGTIMYNNGSKEIRLKVGELVPEGYVKGSCRVNPCQDKKAYYDPKLDKVIFLNPNEDKIPEYFMLGSKWKYSRELWTPEVFDIVTNKDRLVEFISNCKLKCYSEIYSELMKLNFESKLSFSWFSVLMRKYGLNEEMSDRPNRSWYETFIEKYLTSLGFKVETKFRPKWLKWDSNFPKELDIYLPELNIAIEFNGLITHSYKDENYHFMKWKLCKDNGIQLIHIFENSWWNDKVKWCKLFESWKFNKVKVRASKLKVIELPSKITNKFLDLYHFQGSDTSSIRLGLSDGKRLYSVMTFGKPRFTDKYDYELYRYSTNPDYIIYGGGEKLFKYFLNKFLPKSIVSYCDFYKFTGGIYNKLGFEYESLTTDYCYVNLETMEIKSRYQCQKHLIKDLVEDSEYKTEEVIMSELGYNRLYCYCNGKFVKTM